jgi:hypothetical protein
MNIAMNSPTEREPRVSRASEKERYESPTLREVWDESVGTVGLFLLEM